MLLSLQAGSAECLHSRGGYLYSRGGYLFDLASYWELGWSGKKNRCKETGKDLLLMSQQTQDTGFFNCNLPIANPQLLINMLEVSLNSFGGDE